MSTWIATHCLYHCFYTNSSTHLLSFLNVSRAYSIWERCPEHFCFVLLYFEPIHIDYMLYSLSLSSYLSSSLSVNVLQCCSAPVLSTDHSVRCGECSCLIQLLSYLHCLSSDSNFTTIILCHNLSCRPSLTLVPQRQWRYLWNDLMVL